MDITCKWVFYKKMEPAKIPYLWYLWVLRGELFFFPEVTEVHNIGNAPNFMGYRNFNHKDHGSSQRMKNHGGS